MDGKVAVITGAGGGLGRATALELSRRGARVVLVDRAGDDARRTAELLPGESLVVEADVTREDEVAGYLEAARTRFGSIDLHHLNAGIVGTLTPLPQIPLSEFEDVTAVNLRGQFLGMRGAFREYAAQGAGGSIVVTTSIHGLRASADLPVYQMTKHGLVGLVQAGAVYGGPLGVRVNGVAPGVIPTARDEAVRADMAHRAATGPMRRAGRPEEIATAVAFLLSDDASYVNGAILPVDGGAAAVNIVRPSGGAGAWDTGAFDASYYPAD
jgi:Dehydrogenases with different specificities (related to short-chain alcohol dehydrogenases)